MVLRNEFLEARFENGVLVNLSRPSGQNLLTGCFFKYSDGDGDISESPEEGARCLNVVEVQETEHAIVSRFEARGLVMTRRFELRDGSSLLNITCTIEGTGELDEINHPAFPRIVFTDDFTDAFEDEEDLFFDGAELGNGRELPCWRVFFREGHQEGLIAATRSKYEMSHFQIYERSFDIKPHVMTAYTSDYDLAYSPMPMVEGQPWSVSFEIGPWSASDHEEILQAADLDGVQEVSTSSPAVNTGRDSDESLDGVLFDAAEFADPSAISEEFRPDRWMMADMPWCRGGKALYAGPSVTSPPSLVLDPKLSGFHRVFIGIGNGHGIMLKFSGDEMPTFRTPSTNLFFETPFYLTLSGEHEAQEIMVQVLDMTDRTLELQRFANVCASTVIDYVRFEPLTPDEVKEWQDRESREPCIELSGFNDIPDIAQFTDARDPDPVAYSSNLWEHANAGVKKVFWRIDGQCSDFPSRHNTMRYMCARLHGLFVPQGKAYGRVLKKIDMLSLAVKSARDYGLKLYGWMRFNNYSGNVQCDFYKDHPELREESENGGPAAKLCMAHEAVRKLKINILVEAASYGLDGLCLGFLRHPPVSLYAPILVETYRKKYGKLPPRNSNAEDPRHIETLPETDDEYTHWFQHRADFVTQFGRELKAALKDNGLEHVKIALWVRPNHCLFDAIDMKAWLDEGLCDEVVADAIVAWYFKNHECYDVRPEWKELVQAKARLIRGIPGFDYEMAKEMVPQILEEGYDGICTYESDFTVLANDYLDLYRSLRS